ncbi:MAG: fibronectin type III domain-containing protein [Spirochaetes bacterium]|nr:fibronectin type III domain-containing protein [Spirochaetota bacterium]
MKNIVKILILVLVFMSFFSMALCKKVIKGEAPIVSIDPIGNIEIKGTSITITGTIYDPDNDAVKVVGYIEQKPQNQAETTMIATGRYTLEIPLTGLNVNTLYTVVVQGVDSQGNKTVPAPYITFTYKGTPASNIVANADFTQSGWKDLYSSTYDNSSIVTQYLNNKDSGDYVPEWIFLVPDHSNFYNHKVKINISSGSINFQATVNYGQGTEINMYQPLNYSITSNTKIKIVVNISSMGNGSFPFAPYYERTLKLILKIDNTYYIAAILTDSSNSCSHDGKTNLIKNVPTSQDYEKIISIVGLTALNTEDFPGQITFAAGQTIKEIRLKLHTKGSFNVTLKYFGIIEN